jgi:hypothetical protein
MKRHAIGILALLVGITALGLAVIPRIVLDRPLALPAEHHERRAPPKAEPKEGFTFRFKKWSVTFGGGKKDGDANAAAPNAPAARDEELRTERDRLLKWFTISAVSCSLLGLILGPISWVREKQPAISGSAIAISCFAIVWQYIIIGIVVGVAVAVILIVLSHPAG